LCAENVFSCTQIVFLRWFTTVFHVPVAHDIPRYNVTFEALACLPYFDVALHTSRFSVVFAPRRGDAFSGATFGRAAHGDQRTQHLSRACQETYAELETGACGLEDGKAIAEG
jgi:hypothetical protein